MKDKFERIKFSVPNLNIEHSQRKVLENYNYFSVQKNLESCQISSVLNKLNLNLEKISENKSKTESLARHYDYDENTPGNGFWTILHNLCCAVENVEKICAELTKTREKILFNKKSYWKKLDLWNDILASLNHICDVFLEIHENSDKKDLCTADKNWVMLNQLLMSIKQKSFYGSALGFQCAKSVKMIVRVMVSSLVGYSKYHHSKRHKSIRLLDFNVTTSKYFWKPHQRAHKFITASEKGNVEFCKNFWQMTEIGPVHAVPNAFSENVKVNKTFKIPAIPMTVFSEKLQKDVDVPVPHSHFGTAPVSCRLISAVKFPGMIKSKSSKGAEQSKHLLFHAHGGGWAAQTSKSHEIYMKQWANHIKCPILSIDYSLTPGAPFPRAIEEIFYAYCWALNNLNVLGTTAEKIVFAGDSAGANLITAVLVKCIEEGIRVPDGIVNIYGIFDVDFKISPSGSFALIDPILPYGMTTNLIKSYGMDYEASKPKTDINANIIGIDETKEIPEKFDFVFRKSYLLSPIYAPTETLKQFPKIVFLTPILCPLLDNSIDFARKLRDMDVKVQLEVIKGLYHGFLYFINLSKECRDASLLCADHIRKLLED